MPLIDLYRQFGELEPTILAYPDLVQPGEIAAAISTIGGNERLQAVSSLIDQIRHRIKAKPEVPRTLRLRLAVMANSINSLDLRASSTFEGILHDLDRNAVAYELIAPCGDDPPYTAFLARYPMASWRFVDWDKVEAEAGSEVHRGYFDKPEELSAHFEECCRLLRLPDQPVFVTTSIFEASLSLSLNHLKEHSLPLFQCCSDLLLIGENAAWVFEVFHEGEYGYGRAPGTWENGAK